MLLGRRAGRFTYISIHNVAWWSFPVCRKVNNTKFRDAYLLSKIRYGVTAIQPPSYAIINYWFIFREFDGRKVALIFPRDVEAQCGDGVKCFENHEEVVFAF